MGTAVGKVQEYGGRRTWAGLWGAWYGGLLSVGVRCECVLVVCSMWLCTVRA